ncbi:MAG: AMIN domain-containing protein [Micavibrio sp.]
MPRIFPKNPLLIASISMIALTACAATSGANSAKAEAPKPPIPELDAAMAQPAPRAVYPATPSSPSSTPATTVEMQERIVQLEQSLSVLQADYERILPAFASLNATNARLQTLLNEIEQDAGVTPPAPVTHYTPIQSDRVPPAVGVLPAQGSVSPHRAPANGTAVAQTAMTEMPSVPEPVYGSQASAEPAPLFAGLSAQPTLEEVRAEAARQTGSSAVYEERAAAASIAASPSAPMNVSGGSNAVKAVRIGEHGTKTRLVFDLGGAVRPSYKVDVDNGERLLVIDMPGSDWAAAATGSAKSPLIDGWAAQKTPSGGATVAVQLKKTARVLSTEYIGPEGANAARLVIDVAAEG